MVAPKKDSESYYRGDRPDSTDGSVSPARGEAAGGLTERLRDALRGGSDGYPVLDRNDVENGILQWLRALDLQVLGACRADGRLKPLLKLNISTGLTEDRLVSQLNQHFDASEVGMLVRCLCVPLVSIRVGKVNKHGSLLCPTAVRGHLNLNLLPSSNVRISFMGNDGCTERLAVLSGDVENSQVAIEEISADTSGRSFLLKLPGCQVMYFWCSEKSKDHGLQLLGKMKNLLRKKPSLARLTGICESRLDSFGAYIRASLLGSPNIAEANSHTLSAESRANLQSGDSDCHSASMTLKSSRCRLTSPHTTKGQPSHQGSLSPRPNTFKDGTARSLSSIRNGIKEKLRRKENSLLSINQPYTPVSIKSSSQCEDDNIRGSDGCSFLASITQPEIPRLSFSLSPPIPLLINFYPPARSTSGSLLSPNYCWCPPCPPSLQYSVTPSHLPVTFDESMPLPPLSSLLSTAVPTGSLVTSSLPLDVPKLPSMSLPSLLPESFIRLSVPVTSFVTLPSSQQISSFTPYMCDPIVHTQVIDVCSSGQGYLVSAGPALSSVIPPLCSSHVNHPHIPCAESAVESSGRGTLGMLMTSAESAPIFACLKPVIALPEIDGTDENMSIPPVGNRDTVATWSQDTPIDVEAIAMSLSSMGLSSSITVDDHVKGSEMERNDHDYSDDSLNY